MKFSVFTHDDLNAAAPGKSFREVNGALVKETTGALSRSKVETTDVETMADFKELLVSLNAGQHLLSGVSEHEQSVALPAAVLVRSGFGNDKATGLPLVARSNAFFAFPNGPGLLCIDSDSHGQNITCDLVWDALVDACPDSDWRTIIALARLGGLRCPSELTHLKWTDVNWEARTIRITSTKTKRYGKAERTMPAAASSRSAFREIMAGFLPPSSRMIGRTYLPLAKSR